MNRDTEFPCQRCHRIATFNDGVFYCAGMRVCVSCYCELPNDSEPGWRHHKPDTTDMPQGNIGNEPCAQQTD